MIFRIDVNITPKEIQEEIEEENEITIQNIRRFTTRHEGWVVLMGTILITIYGHYLREYVKMFYMRQKICLFVDRPRRCNICQSFTHGTNKCTNEKNVNNVEKIIQN